MSELVEVVGRVAKGRLDLHRDSIAALNEAIRPWEGKTVHITVRRARATRSQTANSYYWAGPIRAISEHTGFTPEETHELMKALHLPKSLAACKKNGEIVAEMVIGGTTTTLNSFEFGEYVRVVKQWALDKLEIVVPEPGETW